MTSTRNETGVITTDPTDIRMKIRVYNYELTCFPKPQIHMLKP